MLSPQEKQYLEKVLEVAGDNKNMIREGIIQALREVGDRARRTYLWNILDRAAREKIKAARQKYATH